MSREKLYFQRQITAIYIYLSIGKNGIIEKKYVREALCRPCGGCNRGLERSWRYA